ncbi:MAG: hypothetical protein ACRECH_17060, partial [Nitrososphaerales archaeon]
MEVAPPPKRTETQIVSKSEDEEQVTLPRRALRVFSPILHRPSALIGIGTLAAVIIFVIIGQLLTPYPPTLTSNSVYSPPSSAHLFGTDYLGKDVFSQVVFGAFPTFAVSLAAAFISVLIGFFG